MQRSSSTPLMAAAAARMSHIPKRAAQHSVCLPGYEIMQPDLKPGVYKMERQLYVEEAKPLEQTYIGVDNPSVSMYDAMSAKMLPEDFADVRKKVIQTEPDCAGGHHGTEHWKSEYKSTHSNDAVSTATKFKQGGPVYQVKSPPTCISWPEFLTTAQEDFGREGENPRSKVAPHHTRVPVARTPLTFGTTKGTDLIPGYQGFISSTPDIPGQPVQSVGERSTVDKSMFTETYHRNIVGYSGHVPLNARNDRGPRRNLPVSTMGRDYVPHKIGLL
mmetsp:Transcript_40201/g.92408  ORF Transcript_40201/g.92408 Transcript_40201/m.92408 type:complete len:274 (+) Transcript_40201:101-922(+)